MSVAEYTW